MSYIETIIYKGETFEAVLNGAARGFAMHDIEGRKIFDDLPADFPVELMPWLVDAFTAGRRDAADEIARAAHAA